MANTKISQLPLWSGTARELRWFVMNNSGETETYKFSGYSAQLIPGTGTSSYRTPDGTASGTNSIAVGNGAGASGTNTISIGNGSIAGTSTIGIGNNLNAITNSSVAIGSALYSNGNFGVMIGNDLAGYTNCVVIGGQSRATGSGGITIGMSNDNNAGVESSILGYNNKISNETYASVLYDLGGSYNNIVASNSFIGFKTTNRNYNSIFGGDSNIIIASGNSNTIIGGVSNTTSGDTSNTFIVNGNSLKSIKTGDVIINSSGNTITGTGTYKQLIGGSGNTISGSYSGVSMINCFGRTATTDNATFVENLHIYRTPSTQVQPVVSGTTFTCDVNNGAKAQFYLTGSSTINITNVRDGQSFMIKTQTNGPITTTWSSTGYTFYFRDEIRNPGNTTIDIWTFEVFGNAIYGSRGHNYGIQL